MSKDIPSLTKAHKLGISAESLVIHVISSEFNQQVVNGLCWGAKQTFIELGGQAKNLFFHQVPGVVEAPLQAQFLLEQDWEEDSEIDAIVILGAVIKGDTDHYEYVCQMVSQGIMQVMLEFSTPISFGVLTVHNQEQADKRAQENNHNKGIEAMLAAIKMSLQSNARK